MVSMETARSVFNIVSIYRDNDGSILFSLERVRSDFTIEFNVYFHPNCNFFLSLTKNIASAAWMFSILG